MTGATALSLTGLFNLIGTNVAGALGDRYRKKYLLSGIYAARSVVIAPSLLLPAPALSTQASRAALTCHCLHPVTLNVGFLQHLFELRYHSTLFGAAFFGHKIA